MTIRDLHNATHHIVKIYISYGDYITELNRSNGLELCAYGKYQVSQIDPTDAGKILVHVKMIPATE